MTITPVTNVTPQAGATPVPAKTSKKPLINMASFRAQHSASQAETEGSASTQTNIPLAKPKDAWFRTSPDPSFYLHNIAGLQANKGGSGIKLLDPELELPDDFPRITYFNLYVYVVSDGTLAVGFYSTTDTSWVPSMQRCILAAQKDWIQIQAKMSMGGYVMKTAPAHGALAKKTPVFSMPADDIFQMAFADHMIVSLDDPIIRVKQGLV